MIKQEYYGHEKILILMIAALKGEDILMWHWIICTSGYQLPDEYTIRVISFVERQWIFLRKITGNFHLCTETSKNAWINKQMETHGAIISNTPTL